ncbi:hypothetical protein C1646_749420 [Rhizophagus diaphanus]|nr:hypothetical protein C1646_749420 [Rhizophagus diaphanus] [Rhizophagus sp. MUCL 43196]
MDSSNLVTSHTNRKRQIEEEEHEKIKTNYYICIKDLPEIIVENIIKYKENIHPDKFQDESKVIADNIAEVISEADEYNWIYNTKTENKKGVTYCYFYFQSNELRRIKILIDETEHIAYIVIKHYILHNLPSDVSVSETIKQFIKDNVNLFPQIIYFQLVTSGMDINIRQKQIHYWWSVYSPVHAIAFLTGFEILLKEQNIIISECGIDATYNTNDQKYELYALIVEVNGTGFPLVYLFLESNGESDANNTTNIITKFLKQLCDQHIQRAVKTKLKDYRAMSHTNYDEYQANRKFSFIDKQFIPIVSANKKTKI